MKKLDETRPMRFKVGLRSVRSVSRLIRVPAPAFKFGFAMFCVLSGGLIRDAIFSTAFAESSQNVPVTNEELREFVSKLTPEQLYKELP